METLLKVGKACTTIPAGFTPHRVVKRVYDARAKMIETGEGVDWAMAEALAFGTLLEEGNHVRLSGQDVERGTFSHRHALIHDQNTGERCVPLRNVYGDSSTPTSLPCNSSLSELGCWALSWGTRLRTPTRSSCGRRSSAISPTRADHHRPVHLLGEAKWLRQTGVTLLLRTGMTVRAPSTAAAGRAIPADVRRRPHQSRGHDPGDALADPGAQLADL